MPLERHGPWIVREHCLKFYKKQGAPELEQQCYTSRESELLLFVFAVPKNVQKRKARPKRSIIKPDEDHSAGLWVDYDLLRKHQNRTPETVLHSPQNAVNNRYLELADIALGVNKPKKKSKSSNGNPSR